MSRVRFVPIGTVTTTLLPESLGESTNRIKKSESEVDVVRWWLRANIMKPDHSVQPGAEKELLCVDDTACDDDVVLRLIYGVPSRHELEHALNELYISNMLHNKMFPGDPYEAKMFIAYNNTLFSVYHSSEELKHDKQTMQNDLRALSTIQFNQCASEIAADIVSEGNSERSFSIYSDSSHSWSSTCSSVSPGLDTLIKVPRLYPLKHKYISGGPAEPTQPIFTEVYVDDEQNLTEDHWDALSENLATMHELGFVHTDIKLANIMWDKKKKRLVLIDFGLAFSNTIGVDVPINDTCVGTDGNWFPFDRLLINGKQVDTDYLNNMHIDKKIELLKHYDRRCLNVVRNGYQHQATKSFPDGLGGTALEWVERCQDWKLSNEKAYNWMPEIQEINICVTNLHLRNPV